MRFIAFTKSTQFSIRYSFIRIVTQNPAASLAENVIRKAHVLFRRSGSTSSVILHDDGASGVGVHVHKDVPELILAGFNIL